MRCRVLIAVLASALLPLSCDTPTNAPELLMIIHIKGVLTVGPDSLPAAGASVTVPAGTSRDFLTGQDYGFSHLGGYSTTDESGRFEMDFELYKCPSSRYFQTSAGFIDRIGPYPHPAPEWECTPDLQEVQLHASPQPNTGG